MLILLNSTRDRIMDMVFIALLILLLGIGFWLFFLKKRFNSKLYKPKNNFLHIFEQKKIKATDPQPSYKDIVSEEDIKLFDSVAKLMFEKEISYCELSFADQIQYEFLNKMPIQATSQIQQFDLNEWSIFWTYKSQSLEYYASKYGIFYTHVDAKGKEHKMEIKFAA